MEQPKRISKGAISRMGYRAGVLQMESGAADVIRQLINNEMDSLIQIASSITHARKKKQITDDIIQLALDLQNDNTVYVHMPRRKPKSLKSKSAVAEATPPADEDEAE